MKAINSLLKSYGTFFRYPAIKAQLQAFYFDAEYHGKSLQDIVKKMRDNDVQDILKEVYNLLCLILSLPSTSVSVERSLKRIKTAARNSMMEERLSSKNRLDIQELVGKSFLVYPIYYKMFQLL